jgi:hypothetical protein
MLLVAYPTQVRSKERQAIHWIEWPVWPIPGTDAYEKSITERAKKTLAPIALEHRLSHGAVLVFSTFAGQVAQKCHHPSIEWFPHR